MAHSNIQAISSIRIDQYPKLIDSLNQSSDKIAHLRNLARTDLYFLLRYGFKRPDVEHQWLFDRCKEVQADPNGYLDLWAREHYKSTIITYAKTVQDILASHGDNPLEEWNGIEPTFGIFSHTRPIAKGFLRQIKREFESNELLKEWFPDVIWENPQKEAPKWSEDDGIILKRKSNPKESTVEAHGLVDGQPTSKHFFVLVYDDVVTRESVTSPEMIKKTTDAWELSNNLGSDGGHERTIGTRYHFNDTYKVMMARGLKQRVYPATHNGELDGEPVFLSQARLNDKLKKQGSYTFGCQMLQNPVADKTQGFKREWLKFYKEMESTKGMNIIILVDPANEKKKKSDWSSFNVIGLNNDSKYYVLDMVRDKLSLTERAKKLIELHKQWKPVFVGYEKYGKDADIEHIEYVQEQENYRFDITELGGTMAKNDRIRRIIPDFENGLIYFPKTLSYTNYQGGSSDLVKDFIDEEYLSFPVGDHDDMIDCLARIKDTDVDFPLEDDWQTAEPIKVNNSYIT